jgi:hypothetical protein
MRFIFYTLAWLCILAGCVYAGFATLAGHLQLSSVLLACGVLIGVGGYFVARKTTRKCRFCGERTERAQTTCKCCGNVLPSGLASLTRW